MPKIADLLKVGDRVYYRGDMANPEAWLVVKLVRPADRWGPESYDFNVESGGFEGQKEIKGIARHMVNAEDSGNGSTRFVTEAAYKALRAARMAEWGAVVARMKAKAA